MLLLIDVTAVLVKLLLGFASLLLHAGVNEMAMPFEQNVTVRATFSGN